MLAGVTVNPVHLRLGFDVASCFFSTLAPTWGRRRRELIKAVGEAGMIEASRYPSEASGAPCRQSPDRDARRDDRASRRWVGTVP